MSETTYRSVYIGKLEIEFSRLSYEDVLCASGINPAEPSLRIDCPELGAWQYIQPPPREQTYA